MDQLRTGEAVAKPRGPSVRVPGLGTPGELLARFGRAVLWLLVAVLLLRGLADVLEPNEPVSAAAAPKAAAATWPDDDAKAFATEFARAYLTFSPGDADASARGGPGVRRAGAGDLDRAGVRRGRQGAGRDVRDGRADGDARPGARAGHRGGRGGRRAGAAVPDRPGRPRRRGRPGGLRPAVVRGRAGPRGHRGGRRRSAVLRRPKAIEPVVSRFLQSYLAGDEAALEYLVPAGTHIAAPAPGARAGRRRVAVARLARRRAASGSCWPPSGPARPTAGPCSPFATGWSWYARTVGM